MTFDNFQPSMTMNNQRSNPYIMAVQQAIFSFQIIEEELKICVGLSYEIIAKSAPSPIIFRFDSKNINNASLGNLIRMFSRVNRNVELISDLEKVLQWRNFCAHNAFLHEFLDRTGISPFTTHSIEEVIAVLKFSSILIERLGNEIKILRDLHRSVP